MKVYFTNCIKSKSGKCKEDGDHVFMAVANKNQCVQRAHTTYEKTPNQELMGMKFKAAASIWRSLSAPFKEDLATYTKLYNQQHKTRREIKVGVYSIFMGALAKYSTPFPNITALVTSYGATLEDWITGGYLKKVNNNGVTFTATVT